MDIVILPPELERYADEAVAAGRFRGLGEVAAAGLKLLRQADLEIAAFVESLEDARAEADRDGWISVDDMVAEMDEIICATADRSAWAVRLVSRGGRGEKPPKCWRVWSTPARRRLCVSLWRPRHAGWEAIRTWGGSRPSLSRHPIGSGR